MLYSFSHRPRARRNERGSALVMVILLALIVSAVGGAMLIMSNSDHRIAANERDSERALQAARAGVAYAFYLFQEDLITPTEAGTAFNSFATGVAEPLEGAEFAGSIIDLSAILSQGQLYRIVSTGTFNRASRVVELTFQIIPDAFKYGYMAFNDATLHNHSGISGPDFRIQSTILSNGSVGVPKDITIDGSIVSSGDVSISSNATIERDIFANSVSNSGTIKGKVRLLTAVEELPADALTWDRMDAFGAKYAWFNGNSTPGSMGGNAPLGGSSSYTIQNDEEFRWTIFNRNGALLSDPNVNVTKYVGPPRLDYAAMKAEADLNDPTYFTTGAAFVNYLITKKVNETINGKDLVTVKVGTPDAPEFIYVADSLNKITVAPGGGDDPGGLQIDADAIFIEGGIYASGGFDFDGPDMADPANGYPTPPDYYMLKINALPYCYPALLIYEEPSSGTIATWTPQDTPPIGGGAAIKMSSGGSEGPAFFNGVVFSQSEIHMHHTDNNREMIRFNGAELAWKVHNCDFFWFSYDPNVRCTRFLVAEEGSPEVVAYREIR